MSIFYIFLPLVLPVLFCYDTYIKLEKEQCL